MTNSAGMLGRFVLLVGFIAAAMILGAGPLYRFAGVDLGLAFTFLKYGSYVAIGTGALAVLWLIVALFSRSAQGLVMVILMPSEKSSPAMRSTCGIAPGKSFGGCTGMK